VTILPYLCYMESAFASKLKALRQKYGYSLQDLADQIGVAKQSIHKFEAGLISPSNETILKLADVFNVPYSHFNETKEAFSYSFDNIRFRNGHEVHEQESFLIEIKEEVLQYISRLMELENLMDTNNVFENPLADLEIEDEKDIEKAAKLLRKKWKVGTDAITDVVYTLENKGVFVVEVKCAENFTGLSAMVAETIPVVVLNENCLTIERKRFTALHELGHLILRFAHNFSDEKIEHFCNHFAGAVLIVDDALYHELGKNRTKISLTELKRIKEKYGISIQAIIVRALAVRFIDYNTFNDWYSAYSEWARNENRETDFGRFTSHEKATRFNNLLLQGLIEKRVSYSKAAEITGSKIDILRQKMNQQLNFSVRN